MDIGCCFGGCALPPLVIPDEIPRFYAQIIGWWLVSKAADLTWAGAPVAWRALRTFLFD